MAKEPKPEPKKIKQQQIPKPPKLLLPDDLEPIYVNLVRIAHTPSEMICDFSRLLPGEKGAVVASRILMSPISAKLFLRALTENLARYETMFGEIKIPSKNTLADHLFRATTPEQPPKKPTEE